MFENIDALKIKLVLGGETKKSAFHSNTFLYVLRINIYDLVDFFIVPLLGYCSFIFIKKIKLHRNRCRYIRESLHLPIEKSLMIIQDFFQQVWLSVSIYGKCILLIPP